MHSAYLVVYLESGTGKFIGAGIHSEPGHSLSQEGHRHTLATVCECVAGSYQEARDLVIENMKLNPAWRWLLQHIRP